MTIHKLTAGDGYLYLTRNIAGGDVVRQRGQDAADYYTAEGNPPGYWLGRGAPLLGLEGTTVTEAQMRALFGHGQHPNAAQIIAAYQAAHVRAGMTDDQLARVVEQARKAATLGRPFPVYQPLEAFESRVAKRLAVIEDEAGRPPTTAEVKKIRGEEAQRKRAAVAGYDVVFAPVKSAALLWALDPREEVRRAVRAAHEEAKASALAMLEEHAAFTRTGTGGVAQIETHGLVAVAFDHYDSRDGDPNPHTHVVLANKLQGVDGKWRSLDGRALYRMTVAASEHYNTAFQTALTAKLGVAWTPRRTAGGREPIYEINGVPPTFIAHFSRRRTALAARYEELIRQHRAEHGRDPSAAACHKLARQANLDTRDGKKPPRSLQAMREQWAAQLRQRFGPHALAGLMRAVPEPSQATAAQSVNLVVPAPEARPLAVDVDALAAWVVAAVGQQRSTWTVWNLHAEAERLLRAEGHATSLAAHRDLVARVVARAAGPGLSILVEAPSVTDEPAALRRSDGVSVFVEHAAARYTSQAVLDAEHRLLDAARTVTTVGLTTARVAASLDGFDAHGNMPLDDGQRQLVTAFATDNRLLVVGLGAAGTGKTTAMRAYLHVLKAGGQRLIPLATSAASAAVLATDLGVPAENLHKFLHEHTAGPYAAQLTAGGAVPASRQLFTVSPGDVILVDEAGMAGTANLDRLVAIARARGAVVRLLGDFRQLGAVESGGALRLIATDVGAVELSTLHRFTDPAEAAATVKLRVGDTSAFDFYERHQRVVGGSRQAMLDAVYAGWHADMCSGIVTLMAAATNADVTALSTQARADRVALRQVEPNGVPLHDGTTAGRGDWIVTRANQRTLTCHGGRDFVRNGDPWQVLTRHRDGSLRVRHLEHAGTVRLPADYVAASVELLYATTTHRAQGSTVATAHVLVTDDMTRENLYVAATRARQCTTLYTVTHDLLPLDPDHRLDQALRDPDARAAREVLDAVLGREAAELSATETIRANQQTAASLATLMPRLIHAADQAADARYQHLAYAMLDATTATALVDDPAWNTVVRVVHQAETDGWQPAQLLAAAARRGPLTDGDSPAQLLAWRLTTIAADHQAPVPLAQPSRADAARYAALIGQATGLTLDPDTALPSPAALRVTPHRDPAADRYARIPADQVHQWAETVAVVLNVDRRTVEAHRAWPLLAGTLAAAHRAGQHPIDLLRTAVHGGDGDLSTVARTTRQLAARRGIPAAAQEVPAPLRHVDTVTRVLGPDLAERARGEAAWPALQGALARAHRAGHDTIQLLRTVAQARDIDTASHVAQVLAWRLSRYTSTLPTPTSADAAVEQWRALAWVMKAHEQADGDPTALLATVPADADLAHTHAAITAAARHAATPQRTERVAPPWTPVTPPAGVPGTAAWRDYLATVEQHIADRTAQLAADAARTRPAWTQVFGTAPSGPADRQYWLRQLGIVAAYRDQHQVADDDPRQPLGPYIPADRAGHHAYWHAAAAIVAARQVADPGYSTLRPRRIGPTDDARTAHCVAVDTYRALPDAERAAIAKVMVGQLGNLWHGHPTDLDTGVTHPAYGAHLTAALTRHGHLGTPETTPAAPAHGEASTTDRHATRDRARQPRTVPQRRPHFPRPRPVHVEPRQPQPTIPPQRRQPTPLVERPLPHQQRPQHSPRPGL